MTPEIWQALIALVGVVYAASVSVIFRDRAPPNPPPIIIHLTREQFAESMKSLEVSVKKWAIVEAEATDLLLTSLTDRLLLLSCVNGETASTHATVHREWRQPPWTQKFEYEDVAIDDDYNERLRQAIRDGHYQFRTVDAANTKIGGWYAIEGVKSSIWVCVAILKNTDTGQVGYLYYSASTHSDDGFTKNDLRLIINFKAVIIRSLLNSDWEFI